MAQQVKDLVLPLQWFTLLLWRRSDLWPGNFHMPGEWPKTSKQRNKPTRYFLGITDLAWLQPKTLADPGSSKRKEKSMGNTAGGIMKARRGISHAQTQIYKW